MQKNPQPVGVLPMFYMQIIGMVAFSMIFSLITLYVTTKVHFGGLGFTSDHAYAIAAAFNALCFATSLPGGYLAERYLGYRFGFFVSILMSTLGMTLLATHSAHTLYLGLGIFIAGSGLMIPCMYVMLGRLYKENDSRREGGFVLAYIGTNVGAFVTASFSGTISKNFGYSVEFLIGACVTVLIFPILWVCRHIYHSKDEQKEMTEKVWGLGWMIVIAAITVGLIDHAMLCNALLLLLGAASVVLVLSIAIVGKEPKVRAKLLVFILLTVMSVAFWALYSLQASALPIFNEHNVNRRLWGYLIPTADLSALNPFFIIVVGPILTYIWNVFAKRGRSVLPPIKFAIGIFLMGLGYLVLAFGVHLASPVGVVALGFLVLSYFSQTTGELMVAPVGYAMVGSLVPKHREGLMMGIWQLATGVGSALSVYFAEYTGAGKVHVAIHTDPGFYHAFLIFGLCTCAVGLFALAVAPFLKRVFD